MSTLIPIVEAYLEAANSHDLEESLAFLTDDVRLEAVGRGTIEGKKEARLSAGWDAVLQSQVQATGLAEAGRYVTCQLEERNEWLRLAGIESVHYPKCRYSFRGRLISHVKTEMSEESRQEVGRVLEAVVVWASRERPVDLGRLLPAGNLPSGPRAAQGWLELLRRWRQHQDESAGG